MTEEKVFERYTWKGEINTIELLIRSRGATVKPPLRNSVERFLESLRFQLEKDSSRQQITKRGTTIPIFQSWLIDLSRKKYSRVTSWETERIQSERELPLAWPSQISIYMQKNHGTLTGHKFGI